MYKISEQNNALEFNRKELERLGLLEIPYILGLKMRIPLSFKSDVSCSLYIWNGKGAFSPTFIKSDVKTPFPNKRIHMLCNKVSRKQSKCFLPLCFDSFEELQKVERVTALWTIKTRLKYEEITEYVIQDNVISGFESKEQAGTYGISCYDYPYLTMFEQELIENDSEEEQNILDKHLSIKDGKIHSDILLGSEYDDVYYFFLEDDTLETFAEYHAEGSEYQVSTEDDFIWGAMGFQSLKRDMMSSSTQKDIVSYYRSVIVLNDRGILTT